MGHNSISDKSSDTFLNALIISSCIIIRHNFPIKLSAVRRSAILDLARTYILLNHLSYFHQHESPNFKSESVRQPSPVKIPSIEHRVSFLPLYRIPPANAAARRALFSPITSKRLYCINSAFWARCFSFLNLLYAWLYVL